MPDTIRSSSSILSLLADNTSGDISAQDLRDAIVSLYAETPASMTMSAFDTETTTGTLNPNYRRIVYLTDSVYNPVVWNGTDWEYYYHGLKCTRPPTSSWSWVNQDSATVSTSSGGIYIQKPAATSSNRAYYLRSAPGNTFTVDVAYIPGNHYENFAANGLQLRESATAKGLAFTHLIAGFYAQRYSTPTTFTSNPLSAFGEFGHIKTPFIYLRIVVGAANITFYQLRDGLNAIQVYQESLTASFTTRPDQYGYVVDPSPNSPVGMHVIHTTAV